MPFTIMDRLEALARERGAILDEYRRALADTADVPRVAAVAYVIPQGADRRARRPIAAGH